MHTRDADDFDAFCRGLVPPGEAVFWWGTPTPPAAPNPGVVAAAQTAANVSSAIASVQLSNVDEVSPQGTLTYTDNGTYVLEDPQFDQNGNQTGTVLRSIPKFKRVTALTVTGQQIFDKQQAVQLATSTLGEEQMSRLRTRMGTEFSLAAAGARGFAPSAPVIDVSTPTRGMLIGTIGVDDTTTERDAIEAAMIARLVDEIENDRSNLITSLECKGIFSGSKAYARSMRAFDLKANDARVQAYLAASKEQATRVAIEREKAEFANGVQQLDLQQRVMLVELVNKNEVQRFQALIELANFIEDLRKTTIQNMVLERTQPMNEFTQVMHGNRIDIPQFRQFQGATVQAAPIGQYIYQSAAMSQDQWKTKVAQQQQMFGAIASSIGAIGGAALGARLPGDTSVGGNLLSRLLG
jgi:hypothetical protein